MRLATISVLCLIIIAALFMGAVDRDGENREYTVTGTEQHEITSDQAQAYIDRFRDTVDHDDIVGGHFGEGIILDILNQESVVGLRYYYGLKENGNPCLVVVGIDSKGQDVNGIWGEESWPCPPFCNEGEPPGSIQ